ncbi:formate dehydrogenase accessory sulfurtransferase FdhD [Acetobacterium tundrae]|uniref:Protein FdhD n=1 Tax=Acetobacterium tundrae TaxID=132932 RepID=A0ABR6WMQ4_9FIRM|nr:formate dehydrogenase accessory sulfurtransferase FdhD [Acetobacterium tundrae]MBC3797591.1 formate dehydrogenase accessory sulfurtransferase FdhD [Acetobacterium tundrae]
MANLDTFLKLAVIKVQGEQSDVVDETIITEYPFKLNVNGNDLCTLYCTPKNLEELVAGYLTSCGMSGTRQDILNIEIDEKNNTAKIQLADYAPSPKKEPLEKPIVVEIQTIYEIMKKNIAPTELFTETGGFHQVAIYDGEKEVVTIMDVARHNAVDKVIGYCILNDIDTRNKILVVSGRISSDMLQKAEKGGISIVASKSAPTSLSIEKADQAGITLVGFIRGERMNVYTHPNRIDLGDELFRLITKKKRINYLRKYFQYLR